MTATLIGLNSKKIILLPISFQKKARNVLPRAYFISNLFCAVDLIIFSPRAPISFTAYSAPRLGFLSSFQLRAPIISRALCPAPRISYRFFHYALFAKERSAARGERLYWLVSSFWISSSDLFFVTGSFRANTKVRAAISAKKQKVGTDNPLSTRVGNTHVSIAHHAQCVMLPKTCPLARTLVGKTSDIRTHITAPRDIANAAIYSISENNI